MVNVLNHFASAALIKPTPAITAANAAAKSGDSPEMIWMATLEAVATIVRMPNTVVFIVVIFTLVFQGVTDAMN